jgi:hypothetical protein
MREDKNEIGQYVSLLNRIIILCAIIIAVPVIVWTMATFVRNQPKVSAFHTLLTAVSIKAPVPTAIGEPTQPSTAKQAKFADPQVSGAPERAESEEPCGECVAAR